MQLFRTVWTILVENQLGIIPNEFGQMGISSLGELFVQSFPYIIQCKIVTPGRGKFSPQEHNLNNFGRGPTDVIYQIWKLWAL